MRRSAEAAPEGGPCLEPLPGTYVLLLEAVHRSRITVGRGRILSVEPGTYLYVGSARGPGGIRGRVGRHLRGVARPHWHVDWLRPKTRLFEIWLAYDPTPREHLWAELLSRSHGVSIPCPGFGSSDCRCASHLLYARSIPSLASLRRRAGGAPILRFQSAESSRMR